MANETLEPDNLSHKQFSKIGKARIILLVVLFASNFVLHLGQNFVDKKVFYCERRKLNQNETIIPEFEIKVKLLIICYHYQ